MNVNNPKQLGGKALGLKRLQQLGVSVPNWLIVHSYQEWLQGNRDLLCKTFGSCYKKKRFAVRSSASIEDGAVNSFAGMFHTELNVDFKELDKAIKHVFNSVNNDNVKAYLSSIKSNEPPKMNVVIQEFIEVDVCGVAFGANPINGKINEKVINSTWGMGEGLVNGDLIADSFFIKDEKVTQKISLKKDCYVSDKSKGIYKTSVPEEKQNQASLNSTQVKEINDLLILLEEKLGSPQDVEFGYKNNQLYLFQTRPITPTKKNSEDYIIWDNSNIVESYPGVTTPLTFSFITKMYQQVYSQFASLMGVAPTVIRANENVFKNTLGLVRGRVYYNLRSWYQMLALVPGFSINAEFMEGMMGVKERFELDNQYRLSTGYAWLRTVVMIVKMIMLQLRLPVIRNKFQEYLNVKLSLYNTTNYSSLNAKEIASNYRQLEKDLLLEWKAPLINDFFSMIWFGMLQKLCVKHFPNQPNIHNDLLCGSNDIISVEPIRMCMEMASCVQQNIELNKLFIGSKPNEIVNQIQKNEYPEFESLFNQYLEKFGHRCIGELKLESVSFHQDPSQLIMVVQQYVLQGLASQKHEQNSKLEIDIRKKAELRVKNKLGKRSVKSWWFSVVLNQARQMVSNRENLRFERTRAFGVVRAMFNGIGNYWHTQGLLKKPNDVFYIDLSELLNLAENELKPNCKKIEIVKKTLQEFKNQQKPSDRFYTYGHNFSDEYIFSEEKIDKIEGDLSGTGCSPGIVESEVILVNRPGDLKSLNGKILVATSTDPGWVTLFPSASGILVERGSLLSHSAIVAREMGIPCIVAVSGLMQSLKSGQKVKMDGSTGLIQLL